MKVIRTDFEGFTTVKIAEIQNMLSTLTTGGNSTEFTLYFDTPAEADAFALQFTEVKVLYTNWEQRLDYEDEEIYGFSNNGTDTTTHIDPDPQHRVKYTGQYHQGELIVRAPGQSIGRVFKYDSL